MRLLEFAERARKMYNQDIKQRVLGGELIDAQLEVEVLDSYISDFRCEFREYIPGEIFVDSVDKLVQITSAGELAPSNLYHNLERSLNVLCLVLPSQVD